VYLVELNAWQVSVNVGSVGAHRACASSCRFCIASSALHISRLLFILYTSMVNTPRPLNVCVRFFGVKVYFIAFERQKVAQ